MRHVRGGRHKRRQFGEPGLAADRGQRSLALQLGRENEGLDGVSAVMEATDAGEDRGVLVEIEVCRLEDVDGRDNCRG